MNINITRYVVLDIETTGMNKLGFHYKGHRIIEIGAVEIINRRLTGQQFHVYLKPNRSVDIEAFNIHGISDEFLIDKPTFSDIADEFLQFVRNSELVIHNAQFDIGFINYELKMLSHVFAKKIDTLCKITDSLLLARKIFPGKRNSLDALCDRYLINNSKRALHGALLDAKILAEIFLLMTGGQTVIHFEKEKNQEHFNKLNKIVRMQQVQNTKILPKVIYANHEETLAHEKQLDLIQEKNGDCLWRKELLI